MRGNFLTFIGTDKGVESSDPDVGLLGGGSHQVERLEVVSVENGEGAVVKVVRADVLIAQHVRVLPRPDLLYALYAHCNSTSKNTVRYQHQQTFICGINRKHYYVHFLFPIY